MSERKEIRAKARQSLKKHYWIFVAACLMAAILGTEYGNTMQLFRLKKERSAQQTSAVEAGPGTSAAEGETSIFNDLINGNWQGPIDAVTDRMDSLKGEQSYVGHVELGHSRGILASVVNMVESGALLMEFLTVIDTILGSRKLAVILLAILGFLIAACFWLFVTNVYRVVYSRVFLEGRLYEKVPLSRFSFLYRVKKHAKASVSIGVAQLLKYLWLFTVVLFPVMRYAYLLVPYLLAENPDLSALEAIRLSRRMMKGHKWEAFVLELTLLPWTLLSLVTGGLVGILFSNPYREAVFAEYYAQIRQLALLEKLEGTDRLNDRFLFELPNESALTFAYEDVVRYEQDRPQTLPARTGVWGKLESLFGIVPSYDAKEKEYRARMFMEMKAEEYRDAMEGKTYPTKLYPIKEVNRRKKAEDAGYLRHYPVPSLVIQFFLICLFGWLWEVTLHLIQTGEFVNRGVLHGPWLPIYGSGGILVLVLLYRLRKKPLAEFVLIVVLCGIVEYGTSWILEVLHDGQRWWDYTGYYLNLNGRICAEGLLVFGIGGMAVIYIVAPLVDNLLEQIRIGILVPVCAALVAVFAADVVVSMISPNTGEGISGGTRTEAGASEAGETEAGQEEAGTDFASQG